MAWLDVNNNGNGGSSTEVKYVKFPVGKTKLRVLDAEPYSRWTHWIKAANAGKGMSVDCIGKGCPVCRAIVEDKKAKREKRYSSSKSHAINVLVKDQLGTAVNEVQILDKGNSIFGMMADIMSESGDLRGYDLTITRRGESLGEISYTVLPVYPPTPLTDSEKALEKVDIKEMRKPLTAEQIEVLMAGGSLAPKEESSDSAGDINIDFTTAV